MTAAEAREKICEEFMAIYAEWFEDRCKLSDHDYGQKYGWGKSEKLMNLKDNLTAVAFFHKYIFSAFRSTARWEEVGYEKQAIWQLNREGFLSYTQEKWKSFYYISQATAKKIYRERKMKNELEHSN